MTTLEEVRARFARDQGLPFADSVSELSILDALNEQGVTFRDRQTVVSHALLATTARQAGADLLRLA